MREAAKAKATSFKGKFSKYTAIANPRLGDQFLKEDNDSSGYNNLILFKICGNLF
jgi:hypothetical protein